MVLLFGTHTLLQLCVAGGQVPSHALLELMHTPKHKVFPLGHSPPQRPAVQVAVPPSGMEHGSQDEPQLRMLASLTHVPPHRWKPALQAIVHVPSAHAARPCASPGHAVQLAPQAVASESSAQPCPQAW